MTRCIGFALVTVVLHASAVWSQQTAAPATGAGASPKPAVVERPGRPEIKRVLQVIPVRDIRVNEMAAMINSVFFDAEVAVLGEPPTLVVSAPEDEMRQVLDVVRQVQQAAGPDTMQQLAVMSVRHRDPRDLLSAIGSLLGGRMVSLAADNERRAIVARGSESDVSWIRSLVEQLDQPARSATLEFAFFRASLGKGEADRSDEGSPIPPDLAGVAKELSRFGSLHLLGRLNTAAVERQKFRVSGEIARRFMIEIQGTLHSGPSDTERVIQIVANIRLLDGGKPVGMYQLETTVLTKPGEFTAIGSAPHGFDVGDAGILVVQVRP